ncbi:MAG: type I restriction-modification system subunit M N-terminal domain-containing protein [Bacteroidales bacterium]|nr:type I restriction-modification system subunit M N-terminal domain-containing protein [Bacteroidales bacterium]
MAKVNTADVGFEKQIWNAADVLRGSMDAAEYKHVVLGLIFLKYISDRFETKYQELVNEGYGLVRTLVEVLKPYHGRVYDPACVPSA